MAAGTRHAEYHAVLGDAVERISRSAEQAIRDPDELARVREHAAAARPAIHSPGG